VTIGQISLGNIVHLLDDANTKIILIIMPTHFSISRIYSCNIHVGTINFGR